MSTVGNHPNTTQRLAQQNFAAINASKKAQEASKEEVAVEEEVVEAPPAVLETEVDSSIKTEGEAKKAEVLGVQIAEDSPESLETEEDKNEKADASALPLTEEEKKAEALGVQIAEDSPEPLKTEEEKKAEASSAEKAEAEAEAEAILDEPLTEKEIAAFKKGLNDKEKAEVDKVIEAGQGKFLKGINEGFPPTEKKKKKKVQKKSSNTRTTATQSNNRRMMEKSTSVRSSNSSSNSNADSDDGYQEQKKQTFSAKTEFSNNIVATAAEVSNITTSGGSGNSSQAVISDVSNVLTSVTDSSSPNVLDTRTSVESSIHLAAGQIDHAVNRAIAGSQANISLQQSLVTSALSDASTANTQGAMANALYNAEMANDAITLEVANAKVSTSRASAEAQSRVMALAESGASQILAVESENREKEESLKQSKPDNSLGAKLEKGFKRFVNGTMNRVAGALVGEGRSPADIHQITGKTPGTIFTGIAPTNNLAPSRGASTGLSGQHLFSGALPSQTSGNINRIANQRSILA